MLESEPLIAVDGEESSTRIISVFMLSLQLHILVMLRARNC